MKLANILWCLAPVIALAHTCAPASEVRGAWVSAWNKGYLTPDEADATIAAAKKAKLNTLFIQVRKTADAYYDSKTEPRGSNLAAGDYDPLAYTIEKAHAQGIKVHAWINVCRVWIGKDPPEDPNHLVNKHPDWLNRDSAGNARASDGMFIDPGVPEARDYVVSVIEDIARRYDVDGIHLDYIRYPGKDWGYSDIALARYKKQMGQTKKPAADNPMWSRWRRTQVTELMKETRKAVKHVRPKAMLSAATITWKDCGPSFPATGPYKLVHQDWQSWLSAGLLDANVPMNYRVESSANDSAQFRAWLGGFRRWSSGKPTYVGIDIYHNSVDGIIKQIQASRNSKMAGFVLFSFNDLPKRSPLVAALAASSPTLEAQKQGRE